MKLGTNNISSVYLGTNAVQKVYLGTNEVWSAFTGLLDDYPNAAAAYSLRKLRSAYTGSAIRVRRASDNTEQDIGFVNGELDTSTLTTFCSGTDGFVTTWYDQSGNGYNATQTTAANQPQIVSSGSVITVNSKPAILGDGINHILQSNFTSTNPTTQFFVYDKIGTGGFFAGLTRSQAAAGQLILQSSGVVGYQQGPQFTPTYANINQALVTFKTSTTGTDWEMWGNSNAITNSGENIGTVSSTEITFFGRGNLLSFTNGYLQEYTLYNYDNTANRTGIESNINNFYSIYP